MRREEEIRLTANKYCLDEYTRLGFIAGAEWADAHHHWISVEDELPPVGQWIITYEPTSPIVVGTDIILPDETADEHHITHWIPLPQGPKGGEI